MKARRVFGIVLRVGAILFERQRVRDLARHGPDMDVDAESPQPLHEAGIKVRDRHRRELHAFERPSLVAICKLVADQIENDIERAARIRIAGATRPREPT